MRGGWLGGIAAGLMAVGLAVCAHGAVSVNGRVIAVEPPARPSGDNLLVPVLSFSPFLGVEAAERDGHVTLRWNGGCGELPSARIRRISGVAYVHIDELAAYVAGTVRRDDGDFDVDVVEARLLDFSAGDDTLVVRFDRFSPTFVAAADGADVVRLYDCRVETPTRSVAFGPEGVGRASLVELGGAICELRITFLEEAAIAVRRFETDGTYSLFLTPADAPSVESTTLLGDGISYFEGATTVGETSVELAYVWVEAWRGRVDVRPLLPPSGAGTQGGMEESMAACGAVVALSSRSGSDTGLVVIDGVPFSIEAEESLALGLDIFGSLGAFFADVRAFAVSSTVRVPVDGVNRPVGYDELVGYPAGYSGDITRGFPEGFSVVRIRDGVVVSILSASFVVADPSATLLVASGASRARLDGLALGERVDLVCEVDPEQRFVRHALSIDRVLLWNGQALPLADGESSTATSWSVAGTDWHGGFFFLTASAEDRLTDQIVLSLLAHLPVTPSSAVVLERDGAGALVLSVGTHYARWGREAPVAVSLSAVLK
jgi:hypothetical protein